MLSVIMLYVILLIVVASFIVQAYEVTPLIFFKQSSS
jgi:hypothetical protein